MTPEQFAYWLQGFFELREAGGDSTKPLTPEQAKMIQEHLQTVFVKVTGAPAQPLVDWEKLIPVPKIDPNPHGPWEYPWTSPPGYIPCDPSPWRPFDIICSPSVTYCHNAS